MKLASTGNIRGVEEAWLSLVDSEVNPAEWQQHADVLEELSKTGHAAEAESMANMTIEALTSSVDPPDVLATASQLLLKIKKSDPLRKTVADLYRQVHGDVEGLDALMTEAGIEGGRPVRRAIRTLDVCLQLKEGSYLARRHEEGAGRVDSIDFDEWEFEVTTEDGSETFGAVELADNFKPTSEDDFYVMAQFDQEKLQKLLKDDPAKIIQSILASNSTEMDSDELKRILTPKHISNSAWTKWWTKARQGLRNSPHVTIEGRSPYFLTYDPVGTSLEDEVKDQIASSHDPLQDLKIVDSYLKGCVNRKETPTLDLIAKIRDRILEREERHNIQTGRFELLPFLAAHKIDGILGDQEADARLIDVMKKLDDPVAAILNVEVPSLWPAACVALEQSHPENLTVALERLLPHAPLDVAETLAKHLVELGHTQDNFAKLADAILREPVGMNEGLLWLWKGSSVDEAKLDVPLVTIASKMFQALASIQRGENISKEHARQIVQNTRDVLRAKKFDRFKTMIEEIQPGVASAIRTQIERLDNLGRAGDDMLSMIRKQFPQLTKVTPSLPKWEREDIMYVTSRGYKNKQAEIDELVNVKMKQNAEAIGAAAALGDLSENSEYKFALEERDLLRARLAQMQNEMAIATVIRPEDVPSDHVGIGSKVMLEHTGSGAKQEVVILSQWEAEPAKQIYNYKTPVAQAILGHQEGDLTTVDFFNPPGEYRVIALASAIAES
ncbi:MAG TPA: GreA/GreB family elongation factor [Phycisphaerae bacterium]|nr:GreA/GreB family elongation factor [Phycisphaerae bacterium]